MTSIHDAHLSSEQATQGRVMKPENHRQSCIVTRDTPYEVAAAICRRSRYRQHQSSLSRSSLISSMLSAPLAPKWHSRHCDYRGMLSPRYRQDSKHADSYNRSAMSSSRQVTGLFKIRVASGEHQGFYVGPHVSAVLSRSTPEVERALQLNGLNYLLYTRESDAICFGSSAAREVQAELRSIGVGSVLI